MATPEQRLLDKFWMIVDLGLAGDAAKNFMPLSLVAPPLSQAHGVFIVGTDIDVEMLDNPSVVNTICFVAQHWLPVRFRSFSYLQSDAYQRDLKTYREFLEAFEDDRVDTDDPSLEDSLEMDMVYCGLQVFNVDLYRITKDAMIKVFTAIFGMNDIRFKANLDISKNLQHVRKKETVFVPETPSNN